MRGSAYRHFRQYVRAAYADADILLRAGEKECIISSDALTKVDVVHLPANRPAEDHYASAKCLSSDTYLFGIFDGHAGTSCSRHVAMQLYDYICASVLHKHVINNLPLENSIEWLFSTISNFNGYRREGHLKNVQRFHRIFSKDTTVTTIREALQAAFCALDDDFLAEALPDSNGKLSRNRVKVVTSGSCGIVAHLRKDHVHIANVGDSAAVLGVRNHGRISARLLSRPHCVDNGDEIKRLRAGHPVAESGSILRSGRLFGELYPLRAFGDARYKWSKELQEKVLKPFGEVPPVGLKTPPYLNAEPEVLYHRLTSNDRFLVLASDGLWEWLDPDTVVRLVFDHQLGAQTLTPYQPPLGALLSQVKEELQERAVGENKKPLDSNSATHVLRHALGGCSGGLDYRYKRLADSLHLPAGMARNYRDDITIVVIHFNQNYFETRQSE